MPVQEAKQKAKLIMKHVSKYEISSVQIRFCLGLFKDPSKRTNSLTKAKFEVSSHQIGPIDNNVNLFKTVNTFQNNMAKWQNIVSRLYKTTSVQGCIVAKMTTQKPQLEA